MSANDNFHHVRDFSYFELPRGMHIDLPQIGSFQITKFMVLQVIAALLVLVIFRGLSKRIGNGQPVAGRFWNFWEMLALFIRDEVVRPTIGDEHHDHGDEHDFHGPGTHDHGMTDAAVKAADTAHPADQYLPFIWSCFFYVLICNLLGAIPFMGSATGNINVTAVLALCSFGATCLFGFQAMGVGGFFGNLVPDTGMSGAGGAALGIGMFFIELMGFFIKHSILALRLFGNIMGGHTALGVMLAFIAAAAHEGAALWGVVTVGSVLGQVGVGILELLVAVLQAYVFSFLATIFIAGAIHKH
ncbi:F0F1 ATP synthase subunit A [Fuerstiella marisgermanici]|uniref:ATP synthase subunit a n=1 Tax=Fuerstiella marisgermanici TaxID=1891926 RepID=A0A1P8WCX0_9PLAN|nr:F0F1 ATP synthase subunit A [Fuerstiella marisgermanici]APZ91897.1 F-ATPase subunit 6 [Fuerstiella marisgermanici]